MHTQLKGLRMERRIGVYYLDGCTGNRDRNENIGEWERAENFGHQSESNQGQAQLLASTLPLFYYHCPDYRMSLPIIEGKNDPDSWESPVIPMSLAVGFTESCRWINFSKGPWFSFWDFDRFSEFMDVVSNISNKSVWCEFIVSKSLQHALICPIGQNLSIYQIQPIMSKISKDLWESNFQRIWFSVKWWDDKDELFLNKKINSSGG